MHDTAKHVPHGHGPNDAYEKSDADVRGIVISAGVFVVFTALILFMVAGFFRFFAGLEDTGPPVSPLAAQREIPPEPRLEVRPYQQFAGERERQESTLHSYGWVDQKAGTVHIPIDRAMDLLLQRGLPMKGEVKPKNATKR